MSENENDRAAFTSRDMAALRWLAVAAGVIFAGFAFISGGDPEVLLLGFGLVLAVMVAGPLAIYGLRKWRAGAGRRRE